jgi:hypothetical protein
VTLGYTSSVFYRAPFLDLYITTVRSTTIKANGWRAAQYGYTRGSGVTTHRIYLKFERRQEQHNPSSESSKYTTLTEHPSNLTTTHLLYFDTVPKLLFKTNMVARVYYFNPGAFVAVQVGPTGLDRHLC